MKIKINGNLLTKNAEGRWERKRSVKGESFVSCSLSIVTDDGYTKHTNIPFGEINLSSDAANELIAAIEKINADNKAAFENAKPEKVSNDI